MDDATFTMHARAILAPHFRPRPTPPILIAPDGSGYRTDVVPCERCGGDGGFEVWTGYDPRDGSPTGYIEKCECVEGEIEIELHPIDEADLDEIDAEGGLAGT